MIDFEKEFEEFVLGNNTNAINEIHKIIPTLDSEQIKIITALTYYAEKYNLLELKAFISEYKKLKAQNKDLSFMKSMNMKNLLKAYTNEEMIRGTKINVHKES